MQHDEFTSHLRGGTAAEQLGDVAARLAAIEMTAMLMRDLIHRLGPPASAEIDVQLRQARRDYQDARLNSPLEGQSADLLLRFAAIRLLLWESPEERQRPRDPPPP